jgi:hypothetical protein
MYDEESALTRVDRTVTHFLLPTSPRSVNLSISVRTAERGT